METERVYPFIGKSALQRTAILFIAIVPFALTLLAMVSLWGNYFTIRDATVFFGFWAIAGMGISVGYHRLVAHGAYKARAPAKFLVLWMAVQALQGGPASWAATHRRHHSLSDKPGDPHSPLDGFWHAHLGWLWKGNLVHEGPAYERILRDPMVRFFERTQLFWFIMTFLMPGMVTGVWAFAQGVTGSALALAISTGILWGGFVRVFAVHHVTWSINSICHTFGTRPYKSPDVARNNVVFGILGFGEGWHNNHHAFPDSAYIGHRWYQVDFGRYMIAGLRLMRLVKSIRYPTREERAARRAKPVSARATAVMLKP